MTFLFLCLKVLFLGEVGEIKFEFWWGLVGGFNFRLGGTYKVPPGSRPKHLKTRSKAKFTDELDGWMDGQTPF